MAVQVTLITSHKGVDLHAATAARVLRERLRGGERLVALQRAEFHAFWRDDAARDSRPGGADRREASGRGEPSVARLLATGRYFNPNKHHYGHFRLAPAGRPWYEMAGASSTQALPAGWPGVAEGADAEGVDEGLFDRLLGGTPVQTATAVDICAYPLGEAGPLLSGVVWRLVLAAGDSTAVALAEEMCVTRDVRRGLLINPHMQGWLLAARASALPNAAGGEGKARR